MVAPLKGAAVIAVVLAVCITALYFKKEKIVIVGEQGFIEHNNYEEKYLGFKTKGDKMAISVNNMPNKKAFLLLLNNFVVAFL